MHIYVYTDESGVFDYKHEKFYIFGGVIFLSKEKRDNETAKYSHVEKIMYRNNNKYEGKELKACLIENKDKGKLFRSMNACDKFGVVIDLKNVNREIFNNKKSKQRYLDYAYKIGLKRALENMIDSKMIDPDRVDYLTVFNDEHTTATNGRYELREGLEGEFRNGTFNYKYDKFFPPLFSNLKDVTVKYCDSRIKEAIRMADIVANRIYHCASINQLNQLSKKVFLSYLP